MDVQHLQDSALLPQLVDVPVFNSPSRPDLGQKGRSIALRTNHFKISIPRVFVHHYSINVQPDSCPLIINKLIIQYMISAYSKVFSSVKPVYDGGNNLYTKDPLPIGKDQIELEVTLPGRFRDRIFHVSIKWLAQVSLLALEEALESHSRQIPLDAISALDVVMSHLPSMTYTTVGRSYFTPPKGHCHSLGGGKEVWHGYYQSVQPSYWKMMLNIDINVAPFYKGQSVIKFLCEILHIRNISNKQKSLSDSQILKFTKEIKDLKIEITHRGKIRIRYRVCGVTKKSALMQTFPLQLENGQIVEYTVAEYFLDKYKIKLKYPHLPCLHVGPEYRHIYLPLEVCILFGGQRCIKKLTEVQTTSLIKETSHNAPEREQEINSLINQINLNDNKYVQEFGLTISNKMLEVSGRILTPPELQYGEGTLPNQEGTNVQQILPKQGVWDMRGKKFYIGVEINVWAIACFAPQKSVLEHELKYFISQLQTISNDADMRIVSQPCFCKYITGIDQVEPMFNYLNTTFTGLQLVVIVLPGKTPVYAEVKRVGDTVLGITTQCIQAKNVIKPSIQVLSNLSLKINAKLGGINSIIVPSIRPKVFNEPLLFLGAYVARPSLCDLKRKSIAAVVGSIDAHPSRYATTVHLQQNREDCIQELSSMVKELLITFYKNTGGFKPHRIILYRDGVPERQLYHVLQYELTAIRKACMTLDGDYKPGITYITVQKHHHTRLFCVDKNEQIGKSGNVPAGTIVDTGITHPTEFDFFLCSHQGIQGTSRPSHYHILWDDNHFQSDELQTLTYQLCHTYVRCTRSVSIPAPVYYAHLVTFRARFHLADKYESNDELQKPGCSEEKKTSIMENAIKLHANIKKVMYFT
ncbi:protein argonaute-2-like [Melanaphis sacchari]|uniref:protein argonaute-2-like n=1 Tax=Melanaphis sacchari TaxID=742174 RepID=UPI000DC1453F|nr:protein argonaute-2-like [Melanaphis sacchari]